MAVIPEQICLAIGWPVDDLSRRRVVEKAVELGLVADGLGYSQGDAWAILAALRVEITAALAADARALRAEQGLPAEEQPRFGAFFHGFLGRGIVGEQGSEPKVWPAWPAAARELG